MRGKKWTIEEDEFLRENYENKTDAELALLLGRGSSEICHRRVRLGIYKPHKLSGRRNKWKKTEIKILKDNYGKISNQNLSQLIGRTKYGIVSKAWKLGLKFKRQKVELICKNCGKKFHVCPSNKWQSFCSKECRLQSHKMMKVCPNCGKKFIRGKVPNRIYCSKSCYFEMMNKKSKARRRKNRKAPIWKWLFQNYPDIFKEYKKYLIKRGNDKRKVYKHLWHQKNKEKKKPIEVDMKKNDSL